MGKCQGFCARPMMIKEFEVTSFVGPNGSYKKGFKKCTMCVISLKNCTTICPCCGNHVRHKPKGRRKWNA